MRISGFVGLEDKLANTKYGGVLAMDPSTAPPPEYAHRIR
jgi:hypothetical protein